MKKKVKKPIKAKCTCQPCPEGVDDMFWRQDEELACERRAAERNKGKAIKVEHQ